MDWIDRMTFRRWLLLVGLPFLLILSAGIARAENYYCVSTTGTKTTGVSTTDIDNFLWADSDCYAMPEDAIAQMSGGDQVWIDDGTYDDTGGTANVYLTSALDGTITDRTIIRARNHGEVTLTSTTGSGVYLNDCMWVWIEGLHAEPPLAVTAYFCHDGSYNVFKRCSFTGENAVTRDNAHHILFEDCFAWGGPLRYAFQVGTSDLADTTNSVIYRRCLVRWDWSDVTEPLSCFGSYYSDSIAYQNCIAVDGTDYESDDIINADNVSGAKAFFTPNGSSNVRYTGCIAMAMKGFTGWWFEGQLGSSGVMQDCVGWGLDGWDLDGRETYKPHYVAVSTSDPGWTIRNCTFGDSDIGIQDSTGTAHLFTFQTEPVDTAEVVRNCIFTGFQLSSTRYVIGSGLQLDSGYNMFYNNTGGRNRVGGVDATSSEDVDPLTNGLQDSPLWIRPCTYCKGGNGENGADIGATIKKRIGVDGTFWGDDGWDEVTTTNLWPFPYEDIIRTKCAAFSLAADSAYTGSPAMDGARGFCGDDPDGDPWTLSTYLRAGGE